MPPLELDDDDDDDDDDEDDEDDDDDEEEEDLAGLGPFDETEVADLKADRAKNEGGEMDEDEQLPREQLPRFRVRKTPSRSVHQAAMGFSAHPGPRASF